MTLTGKGIGGLFFFIIQNPPLMYEMHLNFVIGFKALKLHATNFLSQLTTYHFPLM